MLLSVFSGYRIAQSTTVVGLVNLTVACAAMLALCLFGAGGGAATMGFIIHFHVITDGADLIVGAVAVVSVGVTMTMSPRVLGSGIILHLRPVFTQLDSDGAVPEIILGYTCDLYVVTPGVQM